MALTWHWHGSVVNSCKRFLSVIQESLHSWKRKFGLTNAIWNNQACMKGPELGWSFCCSVKHVSAPQTNTWQLSTWDGQKLRDYLISFSHSICWATKQTNMGFIHIPPDRITARRNNSRKSMTMPLCIVPMFLAETGSENMWFVSVHKYYWKQSGMKSGGRPTTRNAMWKHTAVALESKDRQKKYIGRGRLLHSSRKKKKSFAIYVWGLLHMCSYSFGGKKMKTRQQDLVVVPEHVYHNVQKLPLLLRSNIFTSVFGGCVCRAGCTLKSYSLWNRNKVASGHQKQESYRALSNTQDCVHCLWKEVCALVGIKDSTNFHNHVGFIQIFNRRSLMWIITSASALRIFWPKPENTTSTQLCLCKLSCKRTLAITQFPNNSVIRAKWTKCSYNLGETDRPISCKIRGQPYRFHVVIESYSSLKLEPGPPSWKADKNTYGLKALFIITRLMSALSPYDNLKSSPIWSLQSNKKTRRLLSERSCCCDMIWQRVATADNASSAWGSKYGDRKTPLTSNIRHNKRQNSPLQMFKSSFFF